jgi:hypothetical protein
MTAELTEGDIGQAIKLVRAVTACGRSLPVVTAVVAGLVECK